MDRLWVIFRKFLADCKGMLLNQAHRHATVLLHAEAQHPQEWARLGDWKGIKQNPEKITHNVAKTATLWVKSQDHFPTLLPQGT
jgi:hypothetical protein